MDITYNLDYSGFLNKFYLKLQLRSVGVETQKEKFPDWLKEEDLHELEKTDKNISDLFSSIRENTEITSALNNIFKNWSLGEKPDSISHDYWNDLVNLHEQYHATKNLDEKCRIIETSLHSILEKSPLDSKSELLTDKEWSKLTQFEDKLVTRANDLVRGEKNYAKEKEKNNLIKTQVLKQLKIIDELFLEPNSINKIEGYDNPFSEGNFTNLKKISKLLLKQK